MKTTTAKLVALSVIFIMFVQTSAVADSTPTINENAGITISDEVKQNLEKQSPNERKRVEGAIRAGNQFIPHYVDGSANNITDEQSVKVWRRNIRPLVNKDFDRWVDMVDANSSGLELSIAGKPASGFGICPKVELAAFRVGKKGVTLKYRTRVIGETQNDRFKLFSPYGSYVLDDQEHFQEIQVDMDTHNKVDLIAPKYFGFFVTTDFYITSYQGHIELLTNRLSDLSPDQQMHIKEEIRQYQEWIQLFKEQERSVCRTN